MRRSAYAVAGAVGLGLALVGQFALNGTASASPSPGPGARALTAIQNGDATAHRDSSGKVRYLSTRAGHAIAQTDKSIASTSNAAKSNINDFAPLFGVTNPASDLTAVQTINGPNGPIVRFQQTHNGAPVIGAQLIVSDNASGALVAINGVASNADGVSTTAKISADVAARDAIAAVSKIAKGARLTATKPVLSVYDPSVLGVPDALGARAVYQVTVTDPSGERVNQYILIDAATGTPALSFSQIETLNAPAKTPAVAGAPAAVPAKVPAQSVAPLGTTNPPNQYATDVVCDYSNIAHNDGDSDCPNAGDGIAPVANPAGSAVTDVRDAYDLTGRVNNFYNEFLGRQGIDAHNMGLVSSVQFCYLDDSADCPFANAFWDGKQMVFGDGYASADDVVGHELTHGVTQNTSNLLYYYQSGAINESMSDVMGELFDQWNDNDSVVPGQDGPSYNWLMGEDLPDGALRSMSDPGEFGQPDSMTSANWDSEPYDAGGVHENSGVGNKAGYLVATSIADNPIQKTAAIWLGADELMSPGAQYSDLANALTQSCASLLQANAYGMVDADCTAVANAITTTHMTTVASDGHLAQAYRCGGTYTPMVAFSDMFDRAASGSLGSSWSETGSSSIDGEASPAPPATVPTNGAEIKPGGNALYIPEPVENGSSGIHRYAQTASYISLSSSHTNYLYFNHLDSFDWTYPGSLDGLGYYDGGIVEYQVSGSTSWTSLSSSTWVNGPTAKIISVNKTGFGGDSRGWVSSRATLPSSLKGKKVKFRFSMYTDGVPALSSAYGWWIDNVSLHDCILAPLAPTSVAGKGYAHKATLSWGASSTNGGSSIKNYAVYIDQVGDGVSAVRTTLSSSARSYTWSNLVNGKDYILKIRALNSDGLYSPYVEVDLAGSHLTLAASSTSVPKNTTVTLTGKLTQSTAGTGLASRKIVLYSRATGTTTWTLSSLTATTDVNGNYSLGVVPSKNTDYYTSYSTGSPTRWGTNAWGVSITWS